MVLEAAESWEKMSNSRCHLKAVVKQEISPHPRFSSFQVNGYTFEKKYIYICGTTSVQIGSLYKVPKTSLRACADRLEKEVHQLDRAAPLKVRACKGT